MLFVFYTVYHNICMCQYLDELRQCKLNFFYAIKDETTKLSFNKLSLFVDLYSILSSSNIKLGDWNVYFYVSADHLVLKN